jgi:hypothetical protein
MVFKKYQLSDQQMENIENSLSEEERTLSAEREKSFLAPEKISYNEKSGTLLLSASRESAGVREIEPAAEQNGFSEKSEFHITVLGFRNAGEINKILKKLSSDEREKKISDIRSLIERTDWRFVPESRTLHIAKEYKTSDPKNKGAELTEQRESYIRLVYLPAMESFYAELNSILGSDLLPQPAHITLFTNGTDQEKAKTGIGINTEEELALLTQGEIKL